MTAARFATLALNRTFSLLALILLSAACARASSVKVLYSFNKTPDGVSSGLVQDALGNAYGTMADGSNRTGGFVYQLSPTTGFHVIYTFNGTDGLFPLGGLTFDPAGNLYGVTVYGGSGSSQNCGTIGCGTVFKLTPPAHGGPWTETVLHSFNGPDGDGPEAAITLDSAGNVYGTAILGGAFGSGVVFQLVPGANDQWTQNVLYQFRGGADGGIPQSSLIIDKGGNLYGTAGCCGRANGGTIFELSPAGELWDFSVIYSFKEEGESGYIPVAGLTFDLAGNLYGTTQAGGTFKKGTVFELTANGGSWTEQVLHSFNGSDGQFPESNLVLDRAGNLYGTTNDGGQFGCGGTIGCGTVFRLTPGSTGQWTESVFAFPSNGSLGVDPGTNDNLILDSSGNVYGTTVDGGLYSDGVVFKITP